MMGMTLAVGALFLLGVGGVVAAVAYARKSTVTKSLSDGAQQALTDGVRGAINDNVAKATGILTGGVGQGAAGALSPVGGILSGLGGLASGVAGLLSNTRSNGGADPEVAVGQVGKPNRDQYIAGLRGGGSDDVAVGTVGAGRSGAQYLADLASSGGIARGEVGAGMSGAEYNARLVGSGGFAGTDPFAADFAGSQ